MNALAMPAFVGNDAVLPVQFFSPVSRRSGCHALVQAVLDEAISCLEHGLAFPHYAAPRRLYREARLWVTMTDVAPPLFSFDDVCAYLHLETEAVRALLLRRYPPIEAFPAPSRVCRCYPKGCRSDWVRITGVRLCCRRRTLFDLECNGKLLTLLRRQLHPDSPVHDVGDVGEVIVPRTWARRHGFVEVAP